MIEIVKRPDILNVIKRVYKEYGYSFFDDNKPYNVNIIGVRKLWNHKIDSFDDAILLIYRDESKKLKIHTFEATTESGLHYLNNPINPKGTMILVPDQYRNTYKIGHHQNKYKALVQSREVKVYRDSNRDNYLDLDPKTIEEGYFGANIHRASQYNDLESVGLYSAGCQVIRKNADFNLFMDVINISADMYGNGFTYTLINENDLLSVM